ncbi:hypothetical protein AB0I81_00320 [Nonomuraea sp. NPDC050404]|uniref:hypothetical protein n=1 Tax=Nonomuraea sp. NPDC050404 TaxID=3155783 RepID=UPI0033D36079
MQLHFRNRYTSKICIAIMFFSPDGCRNYGQWGTRGWWCIDPGGEVHVLNTGNRYATFYAEAANGAVWTSDSNYIMVVNHAFDSCIGIGVTPSRSVGTRLVDLGDSDRHFVNLIA